MVLERAAQRKTQDSLVEMTTVAVATVTVVAVLVREKESENGRESHLLETEIGKEKEGQGHEKEIVSAGDEVEVEIERGIKKQVSTLYTSLWALSGLILTEILSDLANKD